MTAEHPSIWGFGLRSSFRIVCPLLLFLYGLACGRLQENGLVMKLRFMDKGRLLAVGSLPGSTSSLQISLTRADHSFHTDSVDRELRRSYDISEGWIRIDDIRPASGLNVIVLAVSESGTVTHATVIPDVEIHAKGMTWLGIVTLGEIPPGGLQGSAEVSLPGSGTSADPWLVSSSADLQAISQTACGLFSSQACAAEYRLDQDIDLQGRTLSGLGYFTGDSSTTTRFTGVFDGGGFTIRNGRIGFSGTSGNGLIISLGSSGVIRNLHFSNVSTYGDEAVGTIAGVSAGSISNCSTSGGTVYGNSSLGGLVGILSSGGTIEDSVSSTAVDGLTRAAGGLAGQMTGGTIQRSSSSGSLNGVARYAGGLVGEITGTAVITDSTASGQIIGADDVGGLVGRVTGDLTLSDCSATGEVLSGSQVSLGAGGLVGRLGAGSINRCHASGTVKATGIGNDAADSGAGGLVGVVSGQASVTDSYSTGNVQGGPRVPAGGLIGMVNLATVSNTYSTGAVSNSDQAGGFIGVMTTATIATSLWNTETSGYTTAWYTAEDPVAGVTGATTTTMQTPSTYTGLGWDTSTVWQTSAGSLPTLR